MRTIKTIIKITVLAAVPILVALSCKRSFLDVPPQGEVTEEQALIDPGAADKMVTGVYNTLYFGGFGNNTVGFLMQLVGDVTSDNADKGSTPTDYNEAVQLDGLTYGPSNAIFNNLWAGHYQAIARVNKAIDILNRSTFDESVKKRLQGEVLFLRGMYYFNLVRMFGGVPKVTRVPLPTEGNSDEFQTRASADDIYTLIKTDLQTAVDNLPRKGDQAAVVGRATKGAAQSLLAKVYLYQKDWQKAFDLSSAVITSGQYGESDYTTSFREVGANNNGSIFEVQTGNHRGNDNCDAVSQIFSIGQGPRAKGGWTNTVDGKKYDGDLGFGFNSPTADLAAAYEANDIRRAATIIFIQPTGGANAGTVLWDGFRIPTQDSVENPRYNYKAYQSPFRETASCNGYLDKDYKPKNIRLIRYNEVLLIYAEAAAMLGNAGEATAKLNMVRGWAGLGTKPGTVANIWQERRVELAMEADRWFDLVRTGQAEQVMKAHGKPFVAGKHELFPIPQAQRDLSGGRLTQNNY